MSLKEPVAKLPLAVRKNWRDEFEAKKGDLEGQISKLLGGQEWKIEIDPNLIFAYAEEGSYGHSSLGDCVKAYIDGAIYRLKYFLESQGHGEAGAAEINQAGDKHIITLYPDATKKFSYCGVDFHEGVMRILFTEGNLGTNIDHALEKIEQALSEAGAGSPGLNYTARNGIKQEYEPHVEELQKKIQEQLHNTDFKLNPNFEAVGDALAKGKDARDDWPQNLGSFTLKYFQSLLHYLEYNKFKDDELMYEGFNEAVTTNEAIFRIVDKVSGHSSYFQTLIEDGKLVIQTTPANWGTNVDYACEKIVDLL